MLPETMDSCKLSFQNPRVLPSQAFSDIFLGHKEESKPKNPPFAKWPLYTATQSGQKGNSKPKPKSVYIWVPLLLLWEESDRH